MENNSTVPQGEEINIRDLLFSCLARWRWFVLALMVCLAVALFYILRTQPLYERSTTVMIKKDDNKGGVSSEIDLSRLGLYSSGTVVSDELSVMTSPTVLSEVAVRLDLRTRYESGGTFKKSLLYGRNLPVIVSLPDVRENESVAFTLELSDNGEVELHEFEVLETKLDLHFCKGRLGDTLSTPAGRLIVNANPSYLSPDEKTPLQTALARSEENSSERGGAGSVATIHVTRSSLLSAVAAMSAALEGDVSSGDKGSSSNIICLNYRDFSTERAEDILNTIVGVYNENWMEDKNRISVSTSRFIDERLRLIEQELSAVDEDISSYKSENLIPDVEAVASMYLTQSSETNARILELNNRLYMTRYVRSYMSDSANDNELLPANSGIENSNIENQIAEFNTLQLQRNRMLTNSSLENPLVQDMDASLNELRKAIIASIDNQILTLNEQIRTLGQTEKRANAQIAASPAQAKTLLSVERQQKVKESLYIYLLQRREENELSMAFVPYNTRVITPAYGDNIPVAPRRNLILIMAILAGLLIPVALVWALLSLDTTIHGRKDVEGLSVPLLGEIPLVIDGTRRGLHRLLDRLKALFRKRGREPEAETSDIVVKQGSRDAVNEAFRVLRSNVEFVSGCENGGNVLMLSSFNVGSGKSFVSANLGVALALRGKEVLLVDGDLRKATISTLAASPKSGLSDYLSGRNPAPLELVKGIPGHEHLSILPVGTLPPNPSELLSGKAFAAALDIFKTMYDYVIVDCPPVDIVADANLIIPFSDRLLFVARAGLFDRSLLQRLDALYREEKYSNMGLVLNATLSGHKYGYGYGYGYGSYGGGRR